MKTRQVAWSMLVVVFAAILAGALATGQTAPAKAAEPSGMVLVPAGTNSGKNPDGGEYSLQVGAFYKDRTEVTKALWDEVCAWAGKNGYDIGGGAGKAPDHPVHSVNWFNAVKWCNARSEKEGRPVCYRVGGNPYRSGTSSGLEPNGLKADLTVAGYRLPTDTEWEYAARGGLKGKRFPWGDTMDHDKANYLGHPSGLAYDTGYAGNDKRYSTDAQPFTAPAGSFPANGYGLHDMTGNVWEWCWEWSPEHMNAHRIIRGGAWSYSADYGRVSSTSGNMYPEFSYWSVGFRCALSAGR